MKKLSLVCFAAAGFALAGPANAAVVPCSSGPGINLTADQCTASGNDNLAAVEGAISAATGIDVSLLNLVLYGKSDDNPGQFSFSPNADPDNGKITDWTVLDGTLIKYVTIKAGTGFKLFELAGAGSAFGSSFSSAGLVNGGGRQPDISHLSFWTAQSSQTPAVPEPSTWAMMLMGFGAIGSAMRRSRKAATRRVKYSFA